MLRFTHVLNVYQFQNLTTLRENVRPLNVDLTVLQMGKPGYARHCFGMTLINGIVTTIFSIKILAIVEYLDKQC